jgi:hypothetical protein
MICEHMLIVAYCISLGVSTMAQFSVNLLVYSSPGGRTHTGWGNMVWPRILSLVTPLVPSTPESELEAARQMLSNEKSLQM